MSKTKNSTESGPWIISASRRSDIPAFHADWFMERVRAGFVEVHNPFVGGRFYRVSLRPEDVHSIVFWSKDYRPLLPYLDELDARGLPLFFQFTITGLPQLYEPRVPPTEVTCETLIYLARRYGADKVNWRFDPLLFSAALQEDYYLQRFRELAAILEGHTQRCIFSFVHFYAKVQRRIIRLAGMGVFDPPLERKRALSVQLAENAAAHGMGLYSCCSDELLQPNVQKSHCIDGELLAELFPERPLTTKLQPSRETCGCSASRDIGAYNSCDHACIYCYANSATWR
jgi:hypothetical protein